MKREIPESFKEHIKHKKGEIPMPQMAPEPKPPAPEKMGRAAKQFHHGHGRRPNPR